MEGISGSTGMEAALLAQILYLHWESWNRDIAPCCDTAISIETYYIVTTSIITHYSDFARLSFLINLIGDLDLAEYIHDMNSPYGGLYEYELFNWQHL